MKETTISAVVTRQQRLVDRKVISPREAGFGIVLDVCHLRYQLEIDPVGELLRILPTMSSELQSGLLDYVSTADEKVFCRNLLSIPGENRVQSRAAVDYRSTPPAVTIFYEDGTQQIIPTGDPFPTVIFAVREYFGIAKGGTWRHGT
ncbi:MAG: hypothetical protein KDA96_11250 [Planctomycetaceae bacterium]|nr:hypothetical protein [Planctomycetaceae bacterium]